MSESLQNIPLHRKEEVGLVAGGLLFSSEATAGVMAPPVGDGEWSHPFVSEVAGDVTAVTLGGNGNAKESPGNRHIRQIWFSGQPFHDLRSLDT